MEIESFLLCDAATQSAGKLNILGAFDTLKSNQIPITHPQCAIALRIRFHRNEAGEHGIEVHIRNADGKELIPPLRGKVNIAFDNIENESISSNLIINIARLEIPDYGEYSIDLTINEKAYTSLPLFVKNR